MDTSDDEQSNIENDEDAEWVHTRERKRRQSRKSSMISTGVCCSCSKTSSCKTSRCECRCKTTAVAALRAAVALRNAATGKSKETIQQSVNMLVSEEAESSQDLAAHGAMLLQTALSDKNSNQSNDGTAPTRKPLSDIGNNLGLSGVPKPTNIRKKWRKSSIQLVPATPPVPQPQNTGAQEEPKANRDVDIPLKLPRAMRWTLTSNSQLKERNTDQTSESADNDVCTSSLGSPHQPAKTRNGKENKGN